MSGDNSFITDEDEIRQWCDNNLIKSYEIRDDGKVDVRGPVNLRRMHLKRIAVKFGKVVGKFDCSDNMLTSLAGSPDVVDGNFNCSDNQLQDLSGAPDEIYGYFICKRTPIRSMRGGPKRVSNRVGLTDVWSLSSLYGAPTSFQGIDLRHASARAARAIEMYCAAVRTLSDEQRESLPRDLVYAMVIRQEPGLTDWLMCGDVAQYLENMDGSNIFDFL